MCGENLRHNGKSGVSMLPLIAIANAGMTSMTLKRMHVRADRASHWECTHRGKVRSMPPAVPMWLRMVKDVRMPRFRRAMQRPLVTATRRLFSGIACHIAANTVGHCWVQHFYKPCVNPVCNHAWQLPTTVDGKDVLPT
jgi:hypothetical protein